MRTEVIMPQMGESVAEGTVTRWLKAIGDEIERDEALFEISTDKVDAEIPSPVAGFLVQILVNEGTTVEINTPVAIISDSKDDVGDAPKAAASAPSPSAPAPAAPVAAAPPAPAAPPPRPAAPLPAAPAGNLPGIDAIEAALRARRERGDIPTAEELRKVRSSPLVRRIAREHGVSLMEIQGTGLDGRVTKDDILGHIERRPAAPVAQPAAAPAAPRQSTTPTSLSGEGASYPHENLPGSYVWKIGERDSVETLSPMRKKIAEHMVISKRISAHVNNFQEVDMTHLVRARAAKKAEFLARTGLKLTYMPFLIAATCQALREFPDINASIVGDQVVQHRDVNIGVAVALDWGLIVPVIKNADDLNVVGITRALTDLAGRARAKKLKVDEVAGGTFSITNPGSFGSLIGMPIIPQPNVAILSVGAITKRPWVIEGPEGDSLGIRHIMMTSLSFDHRLVDGASAALFQVRLKQLLENFDVSGL